jgi:HAD superfamily hydrolase (TIGR01509 family)
MPETKALFFDLDGLMADSEKLHLIGQNMLVSAFCGKGTELTEEDLKNCVGSTDDHTCKYLKETYGLEPAINELIEMRIDFVKQAIDKYGVDKMPGVDEAIAYAGERGWKRGIVSASPAVLVYGMVSQMKLDQTEFDVILHDKSVEQCKPDPAIYLKAAEMVGVDPENCIVLEDSYYGVISAVRAGMYCIVVPNEFSKFKNLSAASNSVNTRTEAVSNNFCQ